MWGTGSPGSPERGTAVWDRALQARSTATWERVPGLFRVGYCCVGQGPRALQGGVLLCGTGSLGYPGQKYCYVGRGPRAIQGGSAAFQGQTSASLCADKAMQTVPWQIDSSSLPLSMTVSLVEGVDLHLTVSGLVSCACHLGFLFAISFFRCLFCRY